MNVVFWKSHMLWNILFVRARFRKYIKQLLKDIHGCWILFLMSIRLKIRVKELFYGDNIHWKLFHEQYNAKDMRGTVVDHNQNLLKFVPD